MYLLNLLQAPLLGIVVYAKPPSKVIISHFWVVRIPVKKQVFSKALCRSTHSPSHSGMDRMDGATVYSISHTVDVGVVNPCLPPYPDCPVCLSEPSRAPGRLRARSVSASEVEVTWKPLAWSNNRRRILGYEVKPTHAHTIWVVQI